MPLRLRGKKRGGRGEGELIMIGSSRVYFLKGGKCSRTVLLKRESFIRKGVFSHRSTCASWKAVV